MSKASNETMSKASNVTRYRLKKLATALLDDEYGINAEAAAELYKLIGLLDSSLLNEIKIGIRATTMAKKLRFINPRSNKQS